MEASESTKARILRAALRLFADRGYEAATMNDIAVAVGIKAPSLYAHHAGKEDLLHALVALALAEWQGMVRDIFARGEACPDLEIGLNLILGDFAAAMAGSVAYRFWARLFVFPPQCLSQDARQAMAGMDRQFADALADLIRRRVPDRAGGPDAALIGTSLVYFLMGILMYAGQMGEIAVRDTLRRGIAFHCGALQA